MEIWKDIKGYEGFYAVSNKGRLKSLHRIKHRINGVPMKIQGRILKQRKSLYYNIKLRKNNHIETFNVHFLVAQAFLNHKKTKGLVIDHIDQNPKNNCVENLRIISHRENLMRSMGVDFKNKQREIANKRKRNRGKFV